MRRLGSCISARALLIPLAAAAMTSLAPTAAHAGGFEIPDNGARALSRGAAFSVLADDLSAIALNPGATTRLPGTRLYLSYDLIYAPLTFERSNSVLAADGERPPPSSSNNSPIFPLGAMIAVSTDFGLEDWRFFAGVYGPNAAGAADYDQDGAARYQLTKLDLALLYVSAGAAWGKADHFGVGVTLQWATVPQSKFELVIDGSTPGSKLNAYTSNQDVLAKFDLSDIGHFTAIIGGWWRVIPELELGLSGRVVPIYMNMKGTLDLQPIGDLFVNGGQVLTQDGHDASITAVIPPSLRTGVRYRHLDATKKREIFDIELNLVYEAWSMMEAYDVTIHSQVEVKAKNGALVQEKKAVPALTVDKQWKDTLSVRVGGTWNAVPDLMAVSLGAFWESGASADDYAYVDFSAYDRYGLGGGFRFLFPGVDLTLSYLHIFQPDVIVDEATGKGAQQRPLGQCPTGCPDGASPVAANAGTFKSSFDQFGISVGLHFDEWTD